MCNIWIFDVGRGLSAVIKTPADKWIMIDLGDDEDFCPINDFLIKHISIDREDKKRRISQLVISHPHDDHITAIEEFDKKIYPALLTVPNDNEGQDPAFMVNWDLVTNPSSDLTDYLKEKMLPGRTPPLKATADDDTKGFIFKIYYLKPKTCETHKDLNKLNYTNNLSIVARLNYKGNVVLFCGDMMKDGMDQLLKEGNLKSDLSTYGVDFLIAPHHGLRSSFSTDLFSAMRGGKPQLNIISERITSTDSKEQVDDRYSYEDYASGCYVHIEGRRENRRRIKTSAVGHTRITLFENKNSMIFTGLSALTIP